MNIFSQINFVEILSSFIVLFVIIDVTGSIPIFLSLKSGDKNIKAGQACLIALLMFVAFFYAGDLLLELFSIDVASFSSSPWKWYSASILSNTTVRALTFLSYLSPFLFWQDLAHWQLYCRYEQITLSWISWLDWY